MNINENNLILKTDSYKASQYKQYPKETTRLFSYAESRGGIYPETIFFGLQYLVKKYLLKQITIEDVEEAKAFFAIHGVDFNYDGWMYIAKDLKGKLPIIIRAVPEGTKVPIKNALMTLESTDPKVFWIVNWLETLLLKIWYSTTVATQSSFLRKEIYNSLVKTSDDPNAEIDFKLHSFGYRGSSSEETAAIGGAAELLSFKGTDTIIGIICANNYYDAGICGFSINASEHSTITSWGKENELAAYRNMLNQFGRNGSVFACVSDSYDIYNACEKLWGTELKEDIIKSGATLVIRPDSGDPEEVVSKCLSILDSKFGSIINSKGYKVINNVRLIQGDGVNPASIKKIMKRIISENYSMTNIAFGMGGASLQGINRDTQQFAFKASHIMVGTKSVDVFKSPVTDPGKVSKSGRLDLIRGGAGGGFTTIKLSSDVSCHNFTAMQTVYKNGELLIDETFETIRERAKV